MTEVCYHTNYQRYARVCIELVDVVLHEPFPEAALSYFRGRVIPRLSPQTKNVFLETGGSAA